MGEESSPSSTQSKVRDMTPKPVEKRSKETMCQVSTALIQFMISKVEQERSALVPRSRRSSWESTRTILTYQQRRFMRTNSCGSCISPIHIVCRYLFVRPTSTPFGTEIEYMLKYREYPKQVPKFRDVHLGRASIACWDS